MNGAAWQLDGLEARLKTEAVDVRVDLLRPGEGLRFRELGGNPTTDELGTGLGPLEDLRLFQVELPNIAPAEAAARIDAYARGPDLVATYAQTAPQEVRTQVYWRWLEFESEPRPIAGFDFMLSVQTSLWDSDPRRSVATSIAGKVGVTRLTTPDLQNDGWPIQLRLGAVSSFGRDTGGGVFAFHANRSNLCYVEMVHPVDFERAEVELSEKIPGVRRLVTLRHRFFEERLEKGVIRRARLRGLFVPANSPRVAAAYREFVSAPPPLST